MCDQILARANEPQRVGFEVRASPALLGNSNESAYTDKNIGNGAISRVEIGRGKAYPII